MDMKNTVNSASEEQRMRTLGAIPLASDILTKASIGLWAFELDEGQPPRMYVDEAMLHLIGLTQQVSPEETYHAWYDHIDKDSYGLVADSVEKMTSGEHAEVQYPWHHPNGQTWIVRCGGVRNFAYTKGVRIEGTHQNVTEVIRFDKEEAEHNRKAKELDSVKQSMNIFFSLADEFDPIAVIEPESGHCEWFSRHEKINSEKFTNDSQSIYDIIRGMKTESLSGEDRQKLYSFFSRENICLVAENGHMRETETRWWIPEENKYRWKYNKAVRMTDESGKVFVVVGISDTTSKREAEAQSETRSILSDYFLRSFSNAQYVDLSQGLVQILRDTRGIGANMIGQIYPIENVLRFFLNHHVHPDDRNMVREQFSVETMRRRLKKEGEYSFTYRDVYEVAPGTYRCTVIPGRDEEHAAIGIQDITETLRIQQQQLVAEELANQQRVMKSFGDMINAALWTMNINEENHVISVTWSDEFRHMFGFEDTRDFPNTVQAWSDRLHPDDKERTMTHFNQAIASEDTESFVYDIQYRILRKNNEYRWYHALGRMEMLDKNTRRMYGIINDITADKRLEEQRALTDGLAHEYHTVWLLEGTGRHALHLYRSTGVNTRKQAVQNEMDNGFYDTAILDYIRDYVHEDDQDRVTQETKFQTIEKETLNVNTYVVSYRRYTDDHSSYDYHQMCYARSVGKDGTVNFVFAYRDADKMLREQTERQKQLTEALAMAQSANRAKTTFLNNMSHDIRTPMNAIIGYTGLAASHIDHKEQVQGYLEKISQSSEHLLSLINDVLDMSRIESGKMNLSEKEEKLSDIIHTLRDIVQSDVHSKQLDFYIDAVDVNDEDIVCDKLRLNQVLLNILSNSIKYTPARGVVTMRVTEKTIKENGYATYEFVIKDTGMGMDKEFIKTIFEPFTRVRNTTVSGIQGTGLGMAITKNIVDMMSGTIEIESEPGRGTAVTVCFDFKLQGGHHAPETIPELKGVRALVVDDDMNTCLSIANMLKDIGMRDEWCASGKEAVFRAEAAYKRGDSYKVYVIDWLMPDMNGVETTRRIRKVVGDEVPIIILTAYDWSDIEDEAREAGVTAFVSKPMFPSDLHRVLNCCVGRITPEESAPDEKFDFEGKKILLVEDNLMNREIATEILEEAGFVVDTAEDGDIAVEKLSKAKRTDYDLVLMDIQMPRMDGYEATRAIRNLQTDVASIPIIAMTANAFEEDRKLALEAGMNEHVPKPINIHVLKATMARFL